MQLPSSYVLDREAIKVNAYRLICHFYANKEIARRTDPDTRDDPIAKLENNYFFREVSRLLLEIAISVRVLDDQMKKLKVSEIKQSYDESMEDVNLRYSCMMFDEMSLREVCNKIIHAEIVEPHMQESEDGRHELDIYNWLGWAEAVEHSPGKDMLGLASVKWKHLTNNVRLGGTYKGSQWWHLLEVPVFVAAISELLS